MQKYYELIRPGIAHSMIMHTFEDVDPLAEALKSGPVESVFEITEARVEEINRAFPVAVEPPDSLTREEVAAAIAKLLARVEAAEAQSRELAKIIAGGGKT